MQAPRKPQGTMSALLAVVLGLALVGFLVGTRARPTAVRSELSAEPARQAEVPRARSNYELSKKPWLSKGQAWDPKAPAEGALVSSAHQKARADAIKLRAERRAFEGAPPTIPHPVGQASSLECRACHEKGIQIGEARAPIWSHRNYTMCTQCHVPEVDALKLSKDLRGAAAVANSFEGLRGAMAPYRWTRGSPPQIPHRTHMRENCSSCHGPSGMPGLHTSHPERQNCQQCHAPAAVSTLLGVP